ncbi:hypothetical protein A2709_02480 [candidate division WWE3 bacterium RIFCSPHIGHO2_01_FULL_43_9]|uniref:F-type ATPase subunit delta n=1 Tax=candidate division WWE3 bacterium RIFCSPHIGHO2_01_FULL_43_9 TaxID=1802618 RepID=A0A1F4V266_UNCKA|nr:MAG: hypothetical protein A2709_02480 [candidate division WWE3 bacterium RIFCSPHIGHO2_01_FULL_43_9]
MPQAISGKDLARSVKTAESKRALLLELEAFALSVDIYLAGNTPLPEDLYPVLLSIPQFRDAIMSKNVDRAWLDAIKKQLQALPEVKIDIATEPSPELYLFVYNWVAEYVDASSIVDLTKTNNLIGGVQLAYKGRYVDMSLDKLVKETLNEKV